MYVASALRWMPVRCGGVGGVLEVSDVCGGIGAALDACEVCVVSVVCWR